jgi:hypothetical protein
MISAILSHFRHLYYYNIIKYLQSDILHLASPIFKVYFSVLMLYFEEFCYFIFFIINYLQLFWINIGVGVLSLFLEGKKGLKTHNLLQNRDVEPQIASFLRNHVF